MKGFFATIMVIAVLCALLLSVLSLPRRLRTTVAKEEIERMFPNTVIHADTTSCRLIIEEQFSSSMDDYLELKRKGLEILPTMQINNCVRYEYPDFRKGSLTIVKDDDCTITVSLAGQNATEIEHSATFTNDQGTVNIIISGVDCKTPALYTELIFGTTKLHYYLR